MNDYVMWRTARMRAAELRAEAREARMAGALRRSRRGSGRYPVRVVDLWGLLAAVGSARGAGEACCA
jgi:hypothetical protein